MAEISIVWIASILASLLISRLLPERLRIDALAAAGFLFLAVNSPWSCLLLSFGALLTLLAVRRARLSRAQWPLLLVVGYSAVVLLVHGLQAKAADFGIDGALRLIGAGYFACRQMHVAFEAYAGRLPALTLREQLRYQFFLPTLLVGPIHRVKTFTRACVRLREEPVDLYSGLERALLGAVKVSVLANRLLAGLVAPWISAHGPVGFAGSYLSGALGWVSLYLIFSGYSDMAIGFAKASGITIEENFNRPWQARNLIDFWQRWHMTLSSWCRDYVYAPLAAATRRHGLALLVAMLVMGIWHEVSVYYLLWGIYHAGGIALCRVLQGSTLINHFGRSYPLQASAAARTATFAWLTGGAPLVGLSVMMMGDLR